MPDRVKLLLADAELGMTTDQGTPTDRWLATVADVMPALDGPAGTAERLLLLLHYGIDWDGGWISNHVATYWDKQLPDRVISSTYLAFGNLRRWWSIIADNLTSTPRNSRERHELVTLLAADPGPVLTALRLETDALLLRVRIVTETVRANRTLVEPRNGTNTAPLQANR